MKQDTFFTPLKTTVGNDKPDRCNTFVVDNRNFSELYISYSAKLIRFAKEFTIPEEDAKNIIQDVFVDLWERKHSLSHVNNVNAYIFRLVKNRCLDYLRHKLLEERYNETTQAAFELELNIKLQSSDRCEMQLIAEKSMEKLIHEAINSLPDRCREIFMLSRFEGLKYREISDRLGLSVNTVENQIGIALKRLKTKLRHCLAA